MPPGMVQLRTAAHGLASVQWCSRSVDTQVLTLRRKLEQAGFGEGGGITTVRQQGYRFFPTIGRNIAEPRLSLGGWQLLLVLFSACSWICRFVCSRGGFNIGTIFHRQKRMLNRFVFTEIRRGR